MHNSTTIEKPVGICIDLLSRKRSEKHNIPTWEDYLRENKIPFEYVDCYRSDIIGELHNYSVLLWHYGNFVNADLMEAQHILDIAEKKGLKVYPDHQTGWHFDDKVAEMYAFQAVEAPIPDSWVFYEEEKCISWLESTANYPLVAKLRRGSGSNNVKLLKNCSEAKKYAHRMFGRGYSPAQSLAYKAYSKIQSAHDLATFKRRMKQIPNFLKARMFGKGMPDERGYCYFQEFTPNDGYDIKVVVVNGKCSYCARKTRKGSFKASGGGEFYYDDKLMTKQIIRSAFDTAEKLAMQCVGFDYVVDNCSGQGKIIEMCHGFDAEAVYNCNGYWDRELVWHEKPLNPPVEMLAELLKTEERSV